MLSLPSQQPGALVVDDSPTICAVLRMQLERAGWQVYTFQDPVQALEYVQQQETPTTVILLDLEMPRMDGYEFFQALRTNAPAPWQSVPCIAITAHDAITARLKAKLVGIDAYLIKPFEIQGLFALLQERFPHLFEPPPISEQRVL